MKRWLVVACLAVGLSATGAAMAKEPAGERGVAYAFDDELLQGGGLDPRLVPITVMKASRRDVLIRPRIQFVRELLASVENL